MEAEIAVEQEVAGDGQEGREEGLEGEEEAAGGSDPLGGSVGAGGGGPRAAASVDHGSTNRGGSHGPHRTVTVPFVSWQTANRPATPRFCFLANRTTNRAVPRLGFELPRFATVLNFHGSPRFANRGTHRCCLSGNI